MRHQARSDSPLRVEEGAERAARQDAPLVLRKGQRPAYRGVHGSCPGRGSRRAGRRDASGCGRGAVSGTSAEIPVAFPPDRDTRGRALSSALLARTLALVGRRGSRTRDASSLFTRRAPRLYRLKYSLSTGSEGKGGPEVRTGEGGQETGTDPPAHDAAALRAPSPPGRRGNGTGRLVPSPSSLTSPVSQSNRTAGCSNSA